VEAIAQKSAKQLTELLERICGSEDLKSDYEELQEKKNESSQQSINVYKRSLLVMQERRLLKEQVKEATTYQELQDKLLNLKIRRWALITVLSLCVTIRIDFCPFCRFLFDLFHIERQLGKFAEEADGHAARLVDCEANCKAISKGQEKKNRDKSVKEKEFQSFDKKVQDYDKLIKKIETKDVLVIDVNLDGKKAQVTTLEKEVKIAQVRPNEFSYV
jgi:structural maintenance of chromosome 1